MSINPAKILKLEKNCINVGAKANMTIVDIENSFTVDSEKFYSKAKFSPYDGMSLKGDVKYTVVNGKIICQEDKFLTKEKKAVLIILVIVAIIGTYINYRPSIEKYAIRSIEIINEDSIKVFDNPSDMEEFSEVFYNKQSEFKPMVLNLSKDRDMTVHLEVGYGKYVVLLIQDDCIKVDNKWYKTDGVFINYVNNFFNEEEGAVAHISHSGYIIS